MGHFETNTKAGSGRWLGAPQLCCGMTERGIWIPKQWMMVEV